MVCCCGGAYCVKVELQSLTTSVSAALSTSICAAIGAVTGWIRACTGAAICATVCTLRLKQNARHIKCAYLYFELNYPFLETINLGH